jgi:hypothetical protein
VSIATQKVVVEHDTPTRTVVSMDDGADHVAPLKLVTLPVPPVTMQNVVLVHETAVALTPMATGADHDEPLDTAASCTLGVVGPLLLTPTAMHWLEPGAHDRATTVIPAGAVVGADQAEPL